MRCLADSPTLSQPTFPTRHMLLFVICQLNTAFRLMISLLLVMGGDCWVPLPLCHPAAAPFLEAVALSLEILIVVGYFFHNSHHFLIGGGELDIVRN